MRVSILFYHERSESNMPSLGQPGKAGQRTRFARKLLNDRAEWRGTSVCPPLLPKGGCLGTKRKRLPRRVSGVKHTSQAAIPHGEWSETDIASRCSSH